MDILSHIPALLTILPMLMATLIVAVNNNKFGNVLFTITCNITFFLSLYLLLKVLNNGLQRYNFGDWIAPFGIEYKITTIRAYVVTILGFLASIIPFIYRVTLAEIGSKKLCLFYGVFLLCISGLMGMVLTNDLFNIYVFLEISSLATYALIAVGLNKQALLASFNYLVIGTVGASLYLAAVGILYAITGSLNIDDIKQILLNQQGYDGLVNLAIILGVVGLAIKSALIPYHFWLAPAYSTAPSVVAAFLAGVATKVSIYVFIIFLGVFDYPQFILDALLVVALVAIIYGSVTALMQNNIARLLAFSSIANIGYIFLGLAIFSQNGLIASTYHIFSHAFAKTAMFVALAIIAFKTGGITLKHFKGMGKASPVTMAGFVLGGLTLIGIPGTSGFITKWYLLQAAIELSLYKQIIVIAFLAIASLTATAYIWKVIEAAYFEKAEYNASPNAGFDLRFALWVLLVITLIFGFNSIPLVDVATQIAQEVMQ